MRGRARSWRWVLGVLGVAVLSGWVALAVVEGQTTFVTVSEYGFELSCPTSVAEGSTLSCTLTNTTDDANDWPVVAILHLSTDADRALVVGAPVDVSFGTLTGSPAIDQNVWWIGDTLVGYSRFDWTGQAPASTVDDDSDARTVSIAATDDTAWETAEAFYVTLGPDSSKGVGFLYDNRQKVSVPRSDSESTDATLSSIEVTAGGTVTRLSPPPATRTINVGYQTTELTVKPAATYKPSKIEVTATFGGSQTQSFEVADGEESESVFLAVGDTSVSVSATAENGTSTQAYQLTVTRAALVGSTVTVSTDEFSLVCPSSVGEGETLVCRLTNTSSAGAPWPVVAFLHSSGDASRALIAEDPIIPDSDPTYSRDLSLRDPQTPAVADYNFGYGELFSGGSRSVYTTYGYEKFDWAGSAAAGAYRDVRVDMAADTLTEPAETFYVAIAPSGYTGLSSLVENRAPVQLTRSGPRVNGPASPSVAENSTTVATYTAAGFDGGTPVLSLSGTDAGLFSISGGLLSFRSAPDFEAPGGKNTYAVTVTATLADVTASLGVTVAVTNLNDEDPVVSGLASVTVAENSTTVATYSATDPDGVTTFTWSLKDADDDDLFAIDTSAGVLTFGSAPDFDDPGDVGGDNVYNVTVEASDGSNTGEHAVVVTVTGVDEPPVVSGLDSKSFAENGTEMVASYSAIDPEGAAVSWASLGGVDAALFQLAANGDLSFRSPPDHETRREVGRDNVYNVTVRASDSSSPANTGEHAVVVTVTNVDEPPVVSGLDSKSFAENGTEMVAAFTARDPEGQTTLIWSLLGPDRDRFAIDGGRLSFGAPPDYEAAADSGTDNVYNVTVRASDGGETGEHAVAVTVTNVEENGSLELSSPQPQVGTELTATLADADGVVSETWRWERSPNRSAWTLISEASSGRYTPVTADFGQFLRATVDYTDGYIPDPYKDLVATSGFATQVTPGLNNAPEFASARVARSVLENAAAGDVVGAAVVANDLENNPLVYSLTVTGVDPAPFTIDRLTGQIRVAERATLNHESRPSLTATVTATDPSRASGSVFVDIMIDGVNEAPMTVPDEAVTQEDTAVIVDVRANDNDPEGDDLTVTVSSELRDGTATVEADGTVLYTPGIDYHGTETFAYEVSDGHFEVDGAVSVTVHPVNDAPVFASADTARTVLAGAAANAPVGSPVTASDVDDATLSYTLEGIDASLFDIEEDTGQIIVADGTVLVAADQYTVTVQARDSHGETDRIEVAISVTERVTPPITGGGGGGPAPPQSAGFTDVDPSGVHATGIEALFAAGITVGCGREPRRFCPDQPVTRAQMATFLARALNLEAPSGSAGFADADPSGVHATGIEALFAAGITVGCGREPRRFCPDQPVTRAQMATFLARALNLEAPSGSAGFADADPSGVHTANIEALFAAGITVGCGREPRRFCPDQPVTRAQMATFLARALNLEAPS